MHAVYGVAAQKTVLNVSKIRLRVFFCSRLVSGTTIFKSAGDTAHLRCRIIKSVHPCTLLMASFVESRNIATG